MARNNNRNPGCATVGGESLTGWMAAFTYQYERFRRKCPGKPLLVVFDIDGTLVDARYAALHAMRAFDRKHGTTFFAESGVEDIHSKEGRTHLAATRCPVSPANVPHFQHWYEDYVRESECILASHAPHRGVFDFMRWLQMQPAAHIAVNTARLEAQRDETMHVLDILGRAFGVRFQPSRIQMRSGRETTVQTAKIAGLRRFIRDGFKVIAVADSEGENIAAMQKSAGFWDETLYLESLAPRVVPRANGQEAMLLDSASEFLQQV